MLRTAAALAVAAALWSWPVPPPHPIARPFIAPATPYSAGHRGLDIAAPAGTRVHAPDDGTVRFAGWVVDRPVLSIDHGGGIVSSFEPVEPLVATGDRVVRGQPVGTLVAGHCVTGCLHLGLRVDGAYLTPLLLLGGLRRPVLYPLP